MSFLTRLFSKRAPPRRSKPSTPTTPLSTPHHLFTINEILEHIFSYLDESTIKRTVILVCHQWLLLCHSQLARDVYWDHRWRTNNLHETLARLPGAGRFLCCCPDSPIDDESRQLILTALRMHDQLYRQGCEKRNRLPRQKGLPFVYTPLRELEIQISYTQLSNVNSLPLPYSLTLLKIQLSNRNGQLFDIGRVMNTCPLLETFSLRVFDYTSGNTSNLTPEKLLPLRSFTLVGLRIRQACLEKLVAVTPNLTELKLIGMGDDYLPSNPLHRLSRLLILPLKSFHYSVQSEIMNIDEIREKMVDVCPAVTEWSMTIHDILPTILHELEALPNVITTLDLVRPYNMTYDTCANSPAVMKNPAILHRFLCTSPHLLHLKGVKMNIYLFEGMDLHRRTGFLDLVKDNRYSYVDESDDAAAIVPGVWACRGLRTLHLNLHGHGEHGLRYPVHSRIVFGYIAAVCPRLEDLEISVMSECKKRGKFRNYFTDFCMRLEGGFCLLSRLEHLTTFRMDAHSIRQSSGCRLLDLNWIMAEGHQPQYREMRRNAIAGWREKLVQEKRLEKERLASDAVNAPVLSIANGDYTEQGLAGQLKGLGLLSEVQAVVEEMDVDGYRCFPVLDRVSFSWALSQRPGDALAYLFPGGHPR